MDNLDSTMELKEPLDRNIASDEDIEEPIPKGLLDRVKDSLHANSLLVLTLVAIVLGFAIGLGIREFEPSKDALMWIGLPGEMFLRMLKMMILPLIVSNIISGTASLGAKSNGKLGVVSLVYVVSTNFLSCILGVILTTAISPGSGTQVNSTATMSSQQMGTQDIFADLIRNLFPSNIVLACTQQTQTKYESESHVASVNASNGTKDVSYIHTTKSLGYADGLIVCSILFGVAANLNKQEGKPFVDFFKSLSELVIIVVGWLLWYTPVGVLSLMVASIANVDDLAATFIKLGLFVATVVSGLAIHQLGIMPVIYFLVAKKNPFAYFAAHIPAWITAFVSTSGAMAIPDMLHGCEEKLSYDKRITRFTIPFVTTLNADGSAIFITSAVMFIAQISGADLNAGQVIIVACLTGVSVMALPSVPSSSIVTVVMILSTLNIPTTEVALLFTVEWLLDRLRTTSNVVSHSMSVPVVNRFVKFDEMAETKGSNYDDENASV